MSIPIEDSKKDEENNPPTLTRTVSKFYRLLLQKIDDSKNMVFNIFNGKHYRKFD